MSKTAIYPGSFDPVTNGHLDIIIRAASMFDKVIVAVLENPDKKNGLFTIEERAELLKKVVSGIDGVEIKSFRGLLVDFAKQVGAEIIVKGLRAVTDFEFEIQMAQMNSKLAPEIETIFMMTDNNYSYLSSSFVKQVAMYGGNIREFVPSIIMEDIIEKMNGNKQSNR